MTGIGGAGTGSAGVRMINFGSGGQQVFDQSSADAADALDQDSSLFQRCFAEDMLAVTQLILDK